MVKFGFSMFFYLCHVFFNASFHSALFSASFGNRPAVKGTLWTRIGLGLVHYGPVLGIEQFLIKRTLSRSFTRTHASTPAYVKGPVGECHF